MNRTGLNQKDNTIITFRERPNADFRITREIGRGASCMVYHAVCSDNTEHLLKEYYPKDLELERDVSGHIIVPDSQKVAFHQGVERFRAACERQKEIRLSNESLKNFTSNVQGYYRANGTEYIDMTCFCGQTYDSVQEQSVYQLMLRMKTLTQVVGNYHRAGLLHLDIKPQNIYVRPQDETAEDVMLFDFDSVIPECEVPTAKFLSCSRSWAAPEQLLAGKRRSICPATDLFAIGEIIFFQLFGRHSTTEERRSFVTEYSYDYTADIFKGMNHKVYPHLNELLSRTICGVISKRYQTAQQLLDKIDEILALADPKEPYLKSSLPVMQDFFIGRDEELETIHHMLSENSILFLNGIGGIGKSELAKHYATQYKDEYDVVILGSYISDVNMLLQNDTAIPIHNFEPYPEEKPEEYCARKLRKLKELCDERTLLILDNLDREDDPDLNKLMELDCKLIVTTRTDFSEYGIGQQLRLGALSDRNDIRTIFDQNYTKELSAEDETKVEQIIDLVEGHTMTVELLAKQMMAGRIKPHKMVEKLQEGGIGSSGKEKVRSAKDGILSAQNTYAHIQTLFDLSELNADEKYILANLALIPHTGISAELFHDWCELEDYECINSLVTEGWVRLDKEKDYISLHPVVRDVASDINVDHDKMLDNIGKITTNENWSRLDLYQQKDTAELLAVIAVALMKSDIRTKTAANFLNSTPGCFWKYGKLREAIDCRKQALKIRLEIYGEMNKYTANTYRNIGILAREYGDMQTAKEYLHKALDIRIALHGEEDSRTARAYGSLSGVYRKEEQYDLAEKYRLKEISIKENLFGYESVDIAGSYNNIGNLYKDMERFDLAEQYYLRALKIYLANAESMDVSMLYHNLGILYRKKGDLIKAEYYGVNAVEFRLNGYGEWHIGTANAYKVLGETYEKMGLHEKARHYYQKALEFWKVHYGETHAKTIRLMKRIDNLSD